MSDVILSKASEAPKASKEVAKEAKEVAKGAKEAAKRSGRKVLQVESPLTPAQDQLVYDLIGIGMRVHTAFGPGLREGVYEDAFVIGLEEAGLSYQRQVPFKVTYLGRPVRSIRIDLIVEDQVVVELKAVSQLHDIHSSQAMTYLKLTGLKVAIIMNFNVQHLRDGIRRHVRKRDPS